MSMQTKTSTKYTAAGTVGNTVMSSETHKSLDGHSLNSAQTEGIITAEKFTMVEGDDYSYVELVTNKGNVVLSRSLDADALASWVNKFGPSEEAMQEQLGALVFAEGVSSIEGEGFGKPFFRLQLPRGAKTTRTDLEVGQ